MVHDLILFLAGIMVGGMNAIAGGGMLIGFPIMLALGYRPLIANATANMAVLPGNIGATYSYRKYLKRVPRQYLFLLIPAFIGAAIGATLLRHTSFKDFNSFIPALVLFAVVLFTFQPVLYNQIQRHLSSSKHSRKSIKPLASVGLAVLPLSIYGGYFGAGFGFVMLAFLGFTRLHDHIHRMNALKCSVTICISAVSIICLYSSHLINWRVGFIMGAGNLLGGIGGASLTQRISSHALRIVVICIGIGTAAFLGLRSY